MKNYETRGKWRGNIKSVGKERHGIIYTLQITSKICSKDVKQLKGFDKRQNFPAKKLLNIPSLFHIPLFSPYLLKSGIVIDVISRNFF